MSIIPWDKVDPSESPFVRLFSLIGIPFVWIDQLCSINSCKDHLVIVVYSQIVVCYLVYQNKIKHHLSLEVLIKWCSSFCYYWFICIIINKIIKLHLPRCYVSVYLCNNNLDCIIYYRMGINYYCLY